MHTIFVYCKGSAELLADRIAARLNHFMKPSMLASQLATLEDPSNEPGVAAVDISASKEDVSRSALEGTRRIVKEMQARGQ
jgi:gluconokinase